ncbi:MAG: beta-N-acetylhexosaminidase [Simkaniaceae bacterium]|nr:beta-N-acetylhexosaminidase [Simkaniaceae bacterium]MCF7852742.1 beta-N-acetylhexosaminidase [Simkaniaceae bacterium]
MNELTLEEKIGQLLLVHFNGEKANDDAKMLIQDVKVGGIIYYNWANGLHSPDQVFQLTHDLQALNSQTECLIPLFIAVDQEGGLVARLTQGFTLFPGNRALGMTNEPQLAEEAAYAMGQELKAVGINFNLAPVVDVNSNPRNPVIGIRSFGDSADLVTSFAQKALLGYKKAEIFTSLKHFPGHGDVDIDSHEALPVIYKTKEQLQQIEFIPFAELANDADTVMTAHILIPSIDPTYCATLSQPILDILRKEMGFKGVIISDSLVMQGLLNQCHSIDDAAIQAFNAGCDILLLGGKNLIGNQPNYELLPEDIRRIHQHLVNAVKTGLISEKKLDESVQRILNLKSKLKPSTQNTSLADRKKHHASLANKIATLAIRKKIN